eukprot:scaffold29424_cov54-Cyclotella_meneghiniana.AAC.11
MKFLYTACVAALFTTGNAFTTAPNALITPAQVPSLGNVGESSGNAHRNRRSTIVMDGKANGEC